MPDKVDAIVSITLGGKERHLKFCFKAMVAFGKRSEKNLFDQKTVKQILFKTTPEDLLLMTWAMLLHEDGNLSVEQVEEWITLENKTECAGAVIRAWSAAMPEGDKKEQSPLAPKSQSG